MHQLLTNSIDTVQSYKNKRAVTIEELMGASVLVGVAILSISPIVIFGISLRNVLMALLVLLVGWDSGIVAGLTAGAFDYLLIAMSYTLPFASIACILKGYFYGIQKIGTMAVLYEYLNNYVGRLNETIPAGKNIINILEDNYQKYCKQNFVASIDKC